MAFVSLHNLWPTLIDHFWTKVAPFESSLINDLQADVTILYYDTYGQDYKLL